MCLRYCGSPRAPRAEWNINGDAEISVYELANALQKARMAYTDDALAITLRGVLRRERDFCATIGFDVNASPADIVTLENRSVVRARSRRSRAIVRDRRLRGGYHTGWRSRRRADQETSASGGARGVRPKRK